MRTYSLLYDSVLSFHMLPIEEINAHKSVLVLVFTTLSSRKSAEKILREVSLFFPQAHVAGLSVFAVAEGGHILESGTFLQILAFDTAKVSVTALKTPDEKGANAAAKQLRYEPGTLLLLCDAQTPMSRRAARALCERFDEAVLTILGSATSHRGAETFLLCGEKTITENAVLIAMEKESLQVELESFQDVETVGPRFEVVASAAGEAERIDGVTAGRFLEERLGPEYLENLPDSGYELFFTSRSDGHGSTAIPLALSATEAVRFGFPISTGSWQLARRRPERSAVMKVPKSGTENGPDFQLMIADPAFLTTGKGRTYRILSNLETRGPVAGVFCSHLAASRTKGELTGFGASLLYLTFSEGKETKKPESATEEIPLPPEEASPSPSLATALVNYGTFLVDKGIFLEETARKLAKDLKRGVMVFDKNLALLFANEKAQRLTALEAKLENGRELKRLEKWIVALLEEALGGKYITRIDKVADPMTGESVLLEIEAEPLMRDGRVLGGIAYLERG